jgi:hypothetical protein
LPTTNARRYMQFGYLGWTSVHRTYRNPFHRADLLSSVVGGSDRPLSTNATVSDSSEYILNSPRT